jgi:NADH-quinone oxidoreductase subunit J
MTELMFYILSAISIISALAVVFTKNPVYSVLALILTMFILAGQYILLNAQFLAIVHIIVYAGAVMVLFLFVLMMLNLNKESEPHKSMPFKIALTVIAGLLLVTLVGSLKGAEQISSEMLMAPDIGLVKSLGMILFTDFVVPFEIASILFLAAMIGAVMVGKRDKEDPDFIPDGKE